MVALIVTCCGSDDQLPILVRARLAFEIGRPPSDWMLVHIPARYLATIVTRAVKEIDDFVNCPHTYCPLFLTQTILQSLRRFSRCGSHLLLTKKTPLVTDVASQISNSAQCRCSFCHQTCFSRLHVPALYLPHIGIDAHQPPPLLTCINGIGPGAF